MFIYFLDLHQRSKIFPSCGMSQYPLRHSTYYTRADGDYTSELPVGTFFNSINNSSFNASEHLQPMNSEEDFIQDKLMKERNDVYMSVENARPKRPNKFAHLFVVSDTEAFFHQVLSAIYLLCTKAAEEKYHQILPRR